MRGTVGLCSDPDFAYFNEATLRQQILASFCAVHLVVKIEIEGSSVMHPEQLVVRCYAVKEQGSWVAVCVDFSLAAQGDSFDEVKQKLDLQIREYVYDALAGEDHEHAGYLLSRKAPLRFRFQYALRAGLSRVARLAGRRRGMIRFEGTLPLVPAHC